MPEPRIDPARPSGSSAPSEAAPADVPAPRGGSGALRVLLVVGVALTVVSGLGLAGALAAYFLGATPSFLPTLYGLSLFGLPLGFTLMVLYLVLSAVRRSRR